MQIQGAIPNTWLYREPLGNTGVGPLLKISRFAIVKQGLEMPGVEQ